jgi:protein involved in polysaccharide export with SLBB domain
MKIVEVSVMTRSIRNLLVVFCCLSLLVAWAIAQQRRTVDIADDPTATIQGRNAVAVTQPSLSVALDAVVDPQQYFVGPSDVLAVNIWTVPPVTLSLAVTPEGSLIVPSVAELQVTGLTLARAKELVLSEVRKRYVHGQCTVTLVRPRQVVVTVLGYVQNPGTYTLSAVDRVSKAVVAPSREVPVRSDFYPVLGDRADSRRIIVAHRDGSTTRADLAMYAATGDGRLNPYLQEGDVIVVTERDPWRGVVGVYGGVNTAGRFQFVPGDSILDMLRLAHGLTQGAIRDSVELQRYDGRGQLISRRVLDYESIAARRSSNVSLEAGDRIVVPERMDLREDYRVTVSGEVRRPGTYPITRNQTRLSEIVRAAGGFTDFATLGSAQLHRPSVRPEQLLLERLESNRGGVSSEDSLYYYLETELRLQKEVVNVNFEALFISGDSTQDVTLKDGDVIDVPSVRRTVYVFGQVVSTGHVPFISGADLNYYIRRAGGVTDRARKGGIKIVKAKTRQWLAPEETTIEEGDYVWVPKTIEYPFGYWLSVVGQTAAIVGASVSLALLVHQLTK